VQVNVARLFAGSVVPRKSSPIKYPYQLSLSIYNVVVYIMLHKLHKRQTMLEIPVAHKSHEDAKPASQVAALPGVYGIMVTVGPTPVSKNVVLLTMIMVFDETVETSVVVPFGRLNADTMGEITGMVDVAVIVTVVVPVELMRVEVAVVVAVVVDVAVPTVTIGIAGTDKDGLYVAIVVIGTVRVAGIGVITVGEGLTPPPEQLG